MSLTRFLLPLLTGAALLSGCASVHETYKDYDPSRKYLRTEAYFSEPIQVPATLSDNKLEDYYPVPQASGKITDDKLSLIPPSNSLKATD